ncbi:MAG: hypothetical protein KC466_15790 [Myxococcales bacterium]|nr:hypothetical protein [Myxococcales bacterium]
MQLRRVAILALPLALLGAFVAPGPARAQLRVLGIETPWEKERAVPLPLHFLDPPRSWYSGAITFRVDGKTDESSFGTRVLYLRGPEKRIVTHLRPALKPWVREKRTFEIHTPEWIIQWREGQPDGQKVTNPFRLVDERIARMAPDEQEIFRENAATLVASTAWLAPGPKVGTGVILEKPCDIYEGPAFKSWIWRDGGIELKRVYPNGDEVEAITINTEIANQDALFVTPMSMRFLLNATTEARARAVADRIFNAVVSGHPLGPEPLVGSSGL